MRIHMIQKQIFGVLIGCYEIFFCNLDTFCRLHLFGWLSLENCSAKNFKIVFIRAPAKKTMIKMWSYGDMNVSNIANLVWWNFQIILTHRVCGKLILLRNNFKWNWGELIERTFALLSAIIVATFEENVIFMLGVVFLFSQFSPIEIIISNKKFQNPIEDIDFLSSNVKRYFTYPFSQRSEGLKIAEFAKFCAKLCAFWNVYS